MKIDTQLDLSIPSAWIRAGAKVSDKTYIGAFVAIEDGVTIEDNVIIKSNVHLYKGTHIKSGTIVESNTAIGATGVAWFGTNKEKDTTFHN